MQHDAFSAFTGAEIFGPERSSFPAYCLTAQTKRNRERLHAVLDVLDADVSRDALPSGLRKRVRERFETGTERDANIRRNLTSPIFTAWLYRLGRALVDRDNNRVQNELSFLPNATLSIDDLATGEVLKLHEKYGQIATWEPQLAFKDSHGAGQINSDDNQTLTKLGSSVTVSYETPRLECVMFDDLVIRNDLWPLRLKMHENGVPDRYTAVQNGVYDMRERIYPKGQEGRIVEALQVIKRIIPQEMDEIQAFLSVIIPRGAPSGWRVEGFTHSAHEGAIWIGLHDPMTIIETLVHEMAHVRLRYIEAVGPLLKDGNYEKRYKVGWRDDPRPIEGIFEGIYVFTRCALAFSKFAEMADAGRERESCIERSTEIWDNVSSAVAIVRKHAFLAPGGEALLEWVEQTHGNYAKEESVRPTAQI